MSNVYSHSARPDITSVALNCSSVLYVRHSVETDSPFCALAFVLKFIAGCKQASASVTFCFTKFSAT